MFFLSFTEVSSLKARLWTYNSIIFVRRLKHKNGRTYIQVIDKSSGKYKVVKSFGSASSLDGIESLSAQASHWIKESRGIAELDFHDEVSAYHSLLNSISAHRLVGIDLVLGRIFDEIGFCRLEDDLFRDLVLYRLVYPKSKLKTTEYLYRYEQKVYSEDDIYRYIDKLYDSQKELVQQTLAIWFCFL